jgi:hypothetical protein
MYLFLFCILILLTFVYAGDITKAYNITTNTVTIKSPTLSKIADIKLISPLHNQVMTGKNQLVASMIFNITDENYKDIINNIQLLNKKDNSNINRNYNLRLKKLTGVRYEDDKKLVCIADKNSINNSKICNLEVVGNISIPVYDYVSFTETDLKGEVELGLFADVYDGDYVEWIPTFYSKEITEWADWEAYTLFERQTDKGYAPGKTENSGQMMAQTFTIGVTGANTTFTFNGVRVGMRNTSAVTTGMGVLIRGCDSNSYPNSTIMSRNTTINWNNMGIDTTFKYFNITMPTMTMEAGKCYALVMNWTAGSWAQTWTLNSAAYPNPLGRQFYSVPPVSYPFTLEDQEMEFYIYGTLPDTIYPTFTNNITSIANNSQYADRDYDFNITITNTNGTTGLLFNGVNYSMSNISSVFNRTLINLSTGIYSYYYWAYGNGTSKNFNRSLTYGYTIIQNTSYNLSITGTTPITSGTTTDVVGSGCPNQLNCTLTPVNAIYGISTIQFNYTSIGNTNYSSKIASINITITSAATTTAINKCLYKQYGYYNLNLPSLIQQNCI